MAQIRYGGTIYDFVMLNPIGWQALSDQAQKLLDGPLAGFVHEEDGPPYVGTDTAALAWRVGPSDKPIVRGTASL